MSRYGPAEAYKLAAVRAAEEVNARAQLVSEFGDLGAIYIALGRMDAALDYTNRMIALATELGNDAELSRGRGNRGMWRVRSRVECARGHGPSRCFCV